MDKEFIDEINKILNEKEIDERVKPLIKLYFSGKFKLGELTTDQLKSEIDTLCSRISNVEFSSNTIVAGYSSKANVLTINKKLFLEGKSDEAILPIFMKFENALNQNNRKNYANHIEDFINAGRIAKSISIPMTDRLHRLYEFSEYCYGDIENKIQELINDDNSWQVVCSKYNNSLNEMIITGIDNSDPEALLNGSCLFHYAIYNNEAFTNPDFESPYKNEEYQKKASKILYCIDTIHPNNTLQKERLFKNIKLFTGCTEEMIETEKNTKYIGEQRISTILENSVKNNSEKITEEFIVARVQEVVDRKPEWDSRIKHLIIPYFIRSQKIYDWDIDEFQERLNEVDIKIDKIVFEDLGNITNMGSTAFDQIKLNSRIFFDRKRSPFLACSQNPFS